MGVLVLLTESTHFPVFAQGDASLQVCIVIIIISITDAITNATSANAITNAIFGDRRRFLQLPHEIRRGFLVLLDVVAQR